MKKRILKIDEICRKYGLGIDQAYCKSRLEALEITRGIGSISGRGMEENEYVQMILEEAVIYNLLVPVFSPIFQSEQHKITRIPDWFRHAIVFRCKEDGSLNAFYENINEFEHMIWFHYLEYDGFDALFTNADVKKCTMLEKFSEQSTKTFVKDRVVELVGKTVNELNENIPYEALLEEIREEIRKEYRNRKGRRWLAEMRCNLQTRE